MERRPLGRNDPCHCGSGKKYKKCHLQEDRETGKSYIYNSSPIESLCDLKSLKQNTLQFIQTLREELGIEFDDLSGTGYVYGEISDAVIRNTYNRLRFFFPHGTEAYKRVYNQVSAKYQSGFYWGDADVNNISNNLTRYSLYTPHIIISNPFCDMSYLHMDASPLENPAIWRQVVVNKAIFLVSIEEWIREDLVTVMPPLKWIDWQFFRDEVRPISSDKLERFTDDQTNELSFYSLLDIAKSIHPDDLEAFVQNYLKGAPKSVIQSFIQTAITEYELNPVRYEWRSGGVDQIINSGSGNSLEAAVLSSGSFGAYLLFGGEYYRKVYDYSIEASDDGTYPTDAYTQLSRSFSALDFSFLNGVKLDFALGLRKENRMSGLRTFLSDMFQRVSSVEGMESLSKDAAFKEELEGQYRLYKEEWMDIQKLIGRNALCSTAEAMVAVLSGSLGISVAAGGFACFNLHQVFEKMDTRKKLEKLPLGVFLKLEQSY